MERVTYEEQVKQVLAGVKPPSLSEAITLGAEMVKERS